MSLKTENIEQKIERITSNIESLKKHRFSKPENNTASEQVLDAAISSLEEFIEILEDDEQYSETLSSAREMSLDE